MQRCLEIRTASTLLSSEIRYPVPHQRITSGRQPRDAIFRPAGVRGSRYLGKPLWGDEATAKET